MSFNGSGTFSINTSGQPVVADTTISATVFNALTADLATGLSTAICKDGQTTITANIPLSTFKLTGVGNGTDRQDAATLANIVAGTGVYVGTVGGTVNAITLTPSPAITAYAAGQKFFFIAGGTNTANVTVAISGLTAKAITKNGATALVAGDILSGQMVMMTYDGTQFILASPRPAANGTIQASTSGTSIDFTSIPAGVKQVRMLLVGVSTSGTSRPLFQIGDSGGIENTGYLGCGVAMAGALTVARATAGAEIISADAANVLHGEIVCTQVDAVLCRWAITYSIGASNADIVMTGAYSKSLTAELDRVRLTTAGGSDTFDNGTINVMYIH